MPLRGATRDENNRPPLDEGGCLEVRRPPPDPLLVQGGGTSFSEEPSMPPSATPRGMKNQGFAFVLVLVVVLGFQDRLRGRGRRR